MSTTVAGTSYQARDTPRLAAPAASPAKARRHKHSTLCPRCWQWRTATQFDRVLGLCEPCAERVVERADAARPRRSPLHSQSIPKTERDNLVQRTADEVAWLAGWSTEHEIAQRLGCPTPEALRRRLYRAGRPDLVAALRNRPARDAT